MLALLGLATVVLLLALIMSRLASPLVALIVVPTAAAIVGGFGLTTAQFMLGERCPDATDWLRRRVRRRSD
jgi:CitMHS family citrate-Mg2+:H+ or citrate-Ca2+:H+ symporter